MRCRRALLGSEDDAVGTVDVEVVRGQPRSEDRNEEEKAHDDKAEEEHEALESVAGAKNREHQNLTRGSTKATMTSIRKLVTQTMMAITVTMP